MAESNNVGSFTTQIAGFTAITAGALVSAALIGWCFGLETLKSLGQPVAMNPVVAVSLLAIATALWMRRRPYAGLSSTWTARILGSTVATVGAWRTADYLGARLPRIDSILFTADLHGNVIAPNTGICLLLLGAAIVTLDLRSRRGRSPAPIFSLCAGLISLAAILGYILAILSMYRLGESIAMALNTATAVLALSVGILLARKSEGLVASTIHRWTVERTMIAAFSLSLLMLFLIGVVAYHSTIMLIAINKLGDQLQGESLNLSELLSEVKDAETGQRGFLLTGDEHYLDPYKQSRTQISESLDLLRSSSKVNDAQRRRFAAMEPLIARKLAEVDLTISLYRSVGFDAAMKIVQSGGGKQLMDRIRSLALAMQTEDRRLSEAGDLEQETVSAQTLRTVALGMLMTVALVVLAAVLILRGMRRQSLARQQLAESDQRFRQLAENISEIFWLTSLDGSQIVYISPAYETIWGRSLKRVYENPQDWLVAIHPEDRQRVHQAFLATAAVGIYDVEFRVVRPDQSVRWVHARGSVIRDGQGRAYRIGGTAADVTDQHLARQAMQAAREAAESANASKSEFLANMSHEIRTPMTAVLGYADMLLDSKLSPSDRLDHIYTIRRNAEHLLEILNDILDVSKIEAGKLHVECIETDVRHVVHDVVSLMRVRALEKNIHLDVTYAGPIPQTIHTDPTRLRQILLNLVGNAVKFTESGGVQIVVTLARESGRTPRMEIATIDSGIGMTPEQVERLFQPFEQGDTSITRKYGGSGLGLTICHRLAQMLGGDIAVQSTPGAGSRFVLTVETGNLDGVPLLFEANESIKPLEANTAIERPVRLRGRVLLAEDGIHNQRVISFYLQNAGVEVVFADNGRVACEKFAEAQAVGSAFDAVLMDMQMPELDGYTATAILRGRGYTGPVIALTAHAMSHDRDKCINAGCTDYLSKPIDRPLLLRTLAKYLLQDQEGEQESFTTDSTGQPEPDVLPFLAGFVADLPAQVTQLLRLAREQDLQSLRSLIHQIKGTGGMYGFGSITDLAEQAEGKLNAEAAINDFEIRVAELVAAMRGVIGYDAVAEAKLSEAGGDR